MEIPSPKSVLDAWSALVGIWGASYLALLEKIDIELAAASESMQWPLLIIGAYGTGSVFLTSWRHSRRSRRR
jgi:hypothetical protein